MKIYKVFALLLCALFITACGTAKQTASPSDTLKKYAEAYDRKDIAAMKQTFSKGTVKMYENAAQKRQISVDDVIKGQFEAGLMDNLASKIETVGEKTEGNTAIVEIKGEAGKENEKMPLVKEDGEWKLAFDEYIETLLKRMNEDMNKMPSSVNSFSNGNTVGENPANKQ